MKIPDYINKVINILNENGYEAYLVGGCVRDYMMGKTQHDFDLTTNALPGEMLQVLADYRIIETGIKHGTVTVVSDGENVEITTYRIDGKYLDNRRPDSVTFTRNLEEDLSRRDFTVNAMAFSPVGGLVDIFGGCDDLKRKIIRCVGVPDTRFNEDGLRIMRALRFSSVLGFTIDSETSKSIRKNKELLKNISAERIYSELKKLLCGAGAAEVLASYADVMGVIFPYFAEHKSIYMTNVLKIGSVDCDVITRFAALFFDIGQSDVRALMHLLKPDNKTLSSVVKLSEKLNEKDIGCDAASVRRLMSFFDSEDMMRFICIMQIYRSDFAYDKFVNEYMHQLEIKPCVKISDLAVNGKDIMSFGIKQRAQIGEILKDVLNAVIEDRCANDYESIKEYIIKNGIGQ